MPDNLKEKKEDLFYWEIVDKKIVKPFLRFLMSSGLYDEWLTASYTLKSYEGDERKYNPYRFLARNNDLFERIWKKEINIEDPTIRSEWVEIIKKIYGPEIMTRWKSICSSISKRFPSTSYKESNVSCIIIPQKGLTPILDYIRTLKEYDPSIIRIGATIEHDSMGRTIGHKLYPFDFLK